MSEDNVTERVEKLLDALQDTGESSIDEKVLAKLDERVRELRRPKNPPKHVDEIEDRESQEAEERLSPETTIELGRIFVGEAGQYEPTLQFDEERSSYVLEAPYGLERADPPGLKRKPLNPRMLDDIREQREGDGFRPPHLRVNFRPELTERVMRYVRKGNDIPEVVFAPDTRYIFRDTAFPWCTSGRVETPGGTCTGTMIGQRLILTAGHCIDWRDDEVGWVKFTPAYYDGNKPFGHAWGTRIIYWDRPDDSDGLSDQETAFDYVVVVLDRNMGDLTGYAGYRTYSSSWNNGNYWQQIGYPGDLSGAQRPAFFSPGAIGSVGSQSTAGQSGYVLGHFMDTSRGHSGGPHWGWWSDEPWPRVVGVQSTGASTPGDDTSGDNEAGGGPALSDLIAYARSNYP